MKEILKIRMTSLIFKLRSCNNQNTRRILDHLGCEKIFDSCWFPSSFQIINTAKNFLIQHQIITMCTLTPTVSPVRKTKQVRLKTLKLIARTPKLASLFSMCPNYKPRKTVGIWYLFCLYLMSTSFWGSRRTQNRKNAKRAQTNIALMEGCQEFLTHVKNHRCAREPAQNIVHRLFSLSVSDG